jgi:hypothetical protein
MLGSDNGISREVRSVLLHDGGAADQERHANVDVIAKSRSPEKGLPKMHRCGMNHPPFAYRRGTIHWMPTLGAPSFTVNPTRS